MIRRIPILAPIDGEIQTAHATRGEFVRPDKPLFEIVDNSSVHVAANVFENDASRIRDMEKARITVEAWPGEQFYGTFITLGAEVQPDTRTIPAIFSVDNKDRRLRGGMFARVHMESSSKTAKLVVPAQAIQFKDGGRLVYKKVAPELFAATPVTVEEFRDGMAIISAGLKAGDRIAATGIYRIRTAPPVNAELTEAGN